MEVENDHSTSSKQTNTIQLLKRLLSKVPNWFWIGVLFFGFPLILNLVITYLAVPWRFVGDGKDWIGFFSNFSGGIIGAFVALFVAKTQGKEQKELFERQLATAVEKESISRKLAQLQPLLIIQYELTESIESLNKVNILRRKTIENIKERENNINPNEEELLEMRKEAEQNVYNIRPINESLFSYIHLIEDFELQRKLYVQLSRYKDFTQALAIDLLSEEWKYTPENGMSLQTAAYEARMLKERRNILFGKKKEEFWHFIDSNFIHTLSELSNSVNSEIEVIKQFKTS